ncbi:hypothetical protein LNP74_17395 [Klebsiella pneumoniae subsp. pneumoniae]|nr:hypothetical protein [Klebsiella pneumoniae subsp. pneumoniae]
MGDIVGRLFRGIRRHPCRRYSYLGGGLLTLTPMMCARMLSLRIAAQAEPILAGPASVSSERVIAAIAHAG